MARIRTIKPEFPQSETMGRLSRDARLLFIQIWTICDDLGRTRGNSRALASLLYPYDDDARDLLPGWLNELEDVGAIRLYLVDGDTYLEVCNWLKHQKIDKPSGPKCPGFDEGSPKPREPSQWDRDPDPDPDPDPEGKGSRTAIASPRTPRRKVSRETIPDPEWFVDLKLAYPNRAGDVRWAAGRRAINARLREGHTPEELRAGVDRYAAYTRATDSWGTQFVKTAPVFFGPDKPFLECWAPPAPSARPNVRKTFEESQHELARLAVGE